MSNLEDHLAEQEAITARHERAGKGRVVFALKALAAAARGQGYKSYNHSTALIDANVTERGDNLTPIARAWARALPPPHEVLGSYLAAGPVSGIDMAAIFERAVVMAEAPIIQQEPVSLHSAFTEVARLIDVAVNYAEDGALATAADRLAEAAEKMRLTAEAKAKALGVPLPRRRVFDVACDTLRDMLPEGYPEDCHTDEAQVVEAILQAVAAKKMVIEFDYNGDRVFHRPDAPVEARLARSRLFDTFSDQEGAFLVSVMDGTHEVGWAILVLGHGNGADCIVDFSTSEACKALLEPALALSRKLGGA